MKEGWRRRPLHSAGLAAALVAAGLVGCGGERSAGPGPRALNVLMIVVDDLRADLGSYGHPIVRSPNIDRLAERGIRFERAYCQFPACNPSRSSFLTGLRPSTTGVLDNEIHFRELLPDVVTLPELFRANGYFTGSIGKVFHGAGGKKGWENPEAWDTALFPRGRRRGKDAERRRFRFESGESIGWIAAGGVDEDQPDGRTAQAAIAVLEQARDRPFFIAAGFLRPHTPLIAPKSYFDLYSLEELGSQLAAGSDSPALGMGRAHLGRIEERGRLELLRAYYACVSFVDAQIGALLDTLTRLDLWRSTVVVLVSDHGIHLGERDWWSKNTLFEVSARVPLIVYAPGAAGGGSSSRALVELIDVYPTLAELAGLTGVPPVDGKSLVPLLEDPDRSWREAAFTQAARGELAGYSVRTERWRYTEWGAESELYDQKTDPLELVDLAADPAHRETVESLRTLLDRLRPDRAGD